MKLSKFLKESKEPTIFKPVSQKTPIHKIVRRLHHSGSPDEALRRAVKNGHLDIIKEILKKYPATREQILNPETHNGKTIEKSLLSVACEEGHRDVVDFLIEYGASPNLGDVGGYFPYDYAEMSGDDGVLEMLIIRGAKVPKRTDPFSR